MDHTILALGLLGTLAGCTGPTTVADKAPVGDSRDSAVLTDSSDSAEDSDSGSDSGDDGLLHKGAFTLASTPKNLLVVSIDTLRRDAVGALTGGSNTPFLDTLASQGVLLAHHHSCSSWTYPGSICAMTGVESEDLGFVPHVPEADEVLPAVPDGTPTLATTLSEQGFQTGLVTANLYLGAETGLGAGFDAQAGVSGLPAEVITDAAVTMFDRTISADLPWFVQVHYVDPHAPYAPPDEYLTGLDSLPAVPWDLSTEGGLSELNGAWAGLSAEDQAVALAHLELRYAGEVHYVDDQIARLFETLDGLGLLDDTLVMIWSDHGEQLYDHGGRGHTLSLYGEENDGLGLFWARGLSAGVWQRGTTNVDLMPTALWLLDINPPEGLVGEAVGTADEDRPIYSMLAPLGRPPAQSVQVGSIKMIYRWDGTKQLFDRDTDPSESANVYDTRPTEVEALWALLGPKVDRAAPLVEDWTPEDPAP